MQPASKSALAFAFLSLVVTACGGVDVHVVDEGGAPIAGAKVTLTSSTDDRGWSKTDKNGDTQFQHSAEPADWFRVEAAGFETVESQSTKAPKPIVVQLHKLGAPAAK